MNPNDPKAVAVAVALGLVLERVLIRHFHRRDHLYQVPLTYGLILMFEEARSLIWGDDVQGVKVPELFAYSIPLTDTLSYPVYRLVISAACLVIAAGMYLLIQRTRLGMMIRAGAHSREMTEAMGINVRLLFALVFALGVALAAFAGMIAAPVSSVYPNMGSQVLIICFVVVVIGGIGSVKGALVAALLFLLSGSTFYIQLVTKVMILAIFAMSLDLLVGYTGLVSLGHAAFFGLAGYGLALIQPKYEPMSILITLPAALALCAAFAAITGALVLRTRGIYFIMVTLAFAQRVYFVFHDTKLGGGSDGLYINAKPVVGWGETSLLNLDDRPTLYWTVLATMVAVHLLLRRVLVSNFGRALQGIKVNEHRMRAIGFPVFRYQLGV